MTDLPGDVNVTFDLDAAERPSAEVQPPFVVKIGGRLVTMKDPGNFDWQDLLDIQHPADFLEYCLDNDDRDHVLNQSDINGWKFNQLMERYMDHYGLQEKVDRYNREQRREQRRGR